MTDADGHRIEAAMQFGFESEEMGDRDDELYQCTESQLIAFAKACERAGRAQVATWAAEYAQKLRLAGLHGGPVLDALIAAVETRNAALDAELAPIKAAEESRFMTARGFVRATDDQPGARWVKPEPSTCMCGRGEQSCPGPDGRPLCAA